MQIDQRTLGDVEYLITLVHGTFAKGAAWTQAGSALRKALTESLGSKAMVQAFDWSGRNTHGARLAAAVELAAFLDKEGAKRPGATPIVVGHSHGGNVALYATNHIKDARNLENIICLATPFLVCGPRARLSLLTQLAWFGLSILIAVPIVLIGTMFIADWVSKQSIYAIWSVWFAAAVAIYIAMRVYLDRSAKRRMKFLSWSAAIRPRLLAIFYRLDEAEMYLSFLNMGTSRLSRLLWNFIAATFVAVFSYALLSVFLRAYAPELFNLPIFSTAHPWWGEGGGPPRRGAWAELVLMFFFFFVPTLLLVAFLLPILRGNPWGYGWEWPSTTMMLDINPVQTPAGIKTVQTEELALDGHEFKHEGLAHSAIYLDPRVHQKILQWITATARV